MPVRIIDIIPSEQVIREFVTNGESLGPDDYLYPFRNAEMSHWGEDEFLGFFDDIRRSFAETEFLLRILTNDDEYRLLETHLPSKGFTLERVFYSAQEQNDSIATETPTNDMLKGTGATPKDKRQELGNNPVADNQTDETHSNQSASSLEQESSIESFDEVRNRMEDLSEGDCIYVFSFNSSMLDSEYNRIVAVHSNLKVIQTFFLRRQLGDANHIIYMRGISDDGNLLCCGTIATTLLETTMDGKTDFRIHEWIKE